VSTDEHDAMKMAIAAANGVRVELGRALSSTLTVAPHTTLLGAVVSIHISAKDADLLSDMVRRAAHNTKELRAGE
jgi:hypothetical protein